MPVISFGDDRSARVATLALNPSSLEFLDRQGNYLLERRRRLASRTSLGRSRPEELGDEDLAQVFDDSNTYFGRNPLWPWSHWLQTLMGSAGLGSLLNRTASHLDLVPWATRPAQGRLQADVWQRLVDADRDFHGWQWADAGDNGPSASRWATAARLRSSDRLSPSCSALRVTRAKVSSGMEVAVFTSQV